jgi:peptide/nickel transport system substrate-binding protein
VTNQRVVGEAFPGYWGAKPGFARVVWRVLPDALTAKNALLAGEIDLFQFVPPEAIPEVQRNPKTRVTETLSARMLFMVINAAEPPLDNKLLRQALNHAIDRKALVEQLYRGRAVALRAPMQETIPELNRSLTGYAHDVQKARDLLKQAGYQGQPIKVNTPIGRYTLDKELGEAVAGMLENAGVKVEFKASEWGGYAQPLFSGKASGISLIGMGNTVFLPDWVFTLWLLPGGQGEAYTKGRPANWEGDVARLALMPRGNRERQPLLDKLQAEALDFAPWILLVNLKDVYALSDRVVWEPYPNEMRSLKDARPRN